MLIEKIVGNVKDFDLTGKIVDKVILSHEDIQKTHQKVRTQGGEELKISLERGAKISCGDILLEEKERIIMVDMPLEKVFELRPKTNMEWARSAYNIGNMHQKAYLYDDCIRIAYDYVLENTIEALKVEFYITEKKLDGIRANISVGQSHHEH